MTTINTHEGKELAKLPVSGIQDVLVARLVTRQEAVRLGFPAQALTQIATAVSEITRNVVQHSGSSGQIRVFEATQNGRRGPADYGGGHGLRYRRCGPRALGSHARSGNSGMPETDG